MEVLIIFNMEGENSFYACSLERLQGFEEERGIPANSLSGGMIGVDDPQDHLNHFQTYYLERELSEAAIAEQSFAFAISINFDF